ncbi:MAG TPA: histidine phosphatase family protein [Acidimicrobiales bacterium]|nr:histidine phosphatase family protein [Acidimicrobiales bacterium]
MRFLTVVRHAESSKATPGQRDVDRPLSERGRAQCDWLRAAAADDSALGRFGPATVLVSAAVRTVETYERAFAGLAIVASMVTSERIYNGFHDVSAEDMLVELAAVDPVSTSLMVVGHNPTVLDLMALLATRLPGKLRKGHFPTGAAYVLGLPEDRPLGSATYDVVAKYVPD